MLQVMHAKFMAHASSLIMLRTHFHVPSTLTACISQDLPGILVYVIFLIVHNWDMMCPPIYLSSSSFPSLIQCLRQLSWLRHTWPYCLKKFNTYTELWPELCPCAPPLTLQVLEEGGRHGDDGLQLRPGQGPPP